MTLLLTLLTGVEAAAQKHRHTQRQQTALVDTTSTDAVEAYSDTTSVDTSTSHKSKVTVTTRTSPWSTRTTTYEMDDEDFGSMVRHAFMNMDSKDLGGMFFVLCSLLIIFVLAPVFIIIALFYFISKNRKEKMRLAQMAMQNGQPIPDQLLKENQFDNTDEEYQKGMRQCFVGVGLMVFLGYAAGNVGFGIGALVFCIGLGKVFAARSTQRRQEKKDDLIQNNYD